MSHITIASRGICNPQWMENFYPEDIPNDWRLDYFANEFPACSLTLQEMSALGLKYNCLGDELPVGLACYLELQSIELSAIPEQLDTQALAGVIYSKTHQMNTSVNDFLRCSKLPFGVLEQVQKDTLTSKPTAVDKLSTYPDRRRHQIDFRLLRIRGGLDLRFVKQVLFDMKNTELNNSVLILDSDTDIENLRSISILAQLL